MARVSPPGALYRRIECERRTVRDEWRIIAVATVERGELTFLGGGDADSLDRARPVLDTLATHVFHLGPIGMGTAMKLSVNTVLAALNEGLAEALVLAEKAGIDRRTAYDVFNA